MSNDVTAPKIWWHLLQKKKSNQKSECLHYCH